VSFQLLPERLGQRQHVISIHRLAVFVKPQPHLIEEMNPAAVLDLRSLPFVLRAEEYRAPEYSAESAGQPAVVVTVLLHSPLI